MFIKDPRDIIKDIKEIITAPIVNIMFLFGGLLVVLSFCRYNREMGFRFFVCPTGPIWLLFILGCLLILGSYYILFGRRGKWINRKINIKKEPSILTFGQFVVKIKEGKIEEISGLDRTWGVVLFANTTFIDECVTDKEGTFGAFNLTHCPERIPELREFIKSELGAMGCQQSSDGTFSVGTLINLSSFYKISTNVFLTASTIKKELEGFRTNPTSICECVRRIFEITADKRISHLRMPIVGSGRGGLSVSAALLLQLISIKYYFTRFSHVKSIDIIVLKKDVKEIPDYVKNLQYAMLSF